MSIRNLERLFKPKSIAIIGASPDTNSIGGILTRNLLLGDYAGKVMLVNPKHQQIYEKPVCPAISLLPESPDLAIVCTPAGTVPSIITDLTRIDCKGVIVITAGFGEGARALGSELHDQILNTAKSTLTRIIGPNCLGIALPLLGLNANFAHLSAKPGSLAFVSQSGAIMTAMLDWAAARDVGFSHIVSLGDMIDVDFGDMLDYLANDPDTKAILLYIESISSARKFMSAARAAARSKPVIVVKAGRFEEGAKAAASHTGALAGSDDVYDAAFRRAGMLRVYTLDDLFDATETLSMARYGVGDRLAIVTNGGGLGVLATDALNELGGKLVTLSQTSMDALDSMLPDAWSHNNPVDILGDARGIRYKEALSILGKDKNIDAILALYCPTAMATSEETAEAVVESIKVLGKKQLIVSWVGDVSGAKARPIFDAHRIPSYSTPEHAVGAYMQLVEYRRNQELLMETPASEPEKFTPDTSAAYVLVRACLEEERYWMSEPEAKSILSAYAIPTVTVQTIRTPKDAARLASKLGGSLVLKILSPDITHKSDVGGVALDLIGPEAVEGAAKEMLKRVKEIRPDAKVEGFTLQKMVCKPHAYELFVGVKNDAQFGPVLVFGQGGIAVELINDKAVGLPPLNMRLAKELIYRTQISKLLSGFRNQAAVNLDILAMTMIKVSQLIIDIPEIEELDINPLLSDQDGVLALDARIKLSKLDDKRPGQLAIKPYPKELEEEVQSGDGRSLFLRPILPEDEKPLQTAFSTLTQEEIRMRFFVTMKSLSHLMAARFTQIDYDREMALVLTEKGIPGTTALFGVVRISADPDNEVAEFAIIVRHDVAGLGLGTLLMKRIIDYARNKGIKRIVGDVLKGNVKMLGLSEQLGFIRSAVIHDSGSFRISLNLN